MQDNFEVRNKKLYRLPIFQMRAFEVEDDIPKDFRDDGIVLDPVYDEKKVNQIPLSLNR